ncbi:001970a5-5de7-46e6-a2f3-5a7541433e97 [Thermothielavioides terrestris]|uniref:001970a5-5de7-46e6-a2f3-5a7541433e97 n=1 Tax=Thermothielavioides terrestris TaxID=2587410 RepID=A0A446BSM2_9PEZI|nr:001970a5-5de7-46e6-a2f3-5a7541433e97 [Thermothielavioides terrestris]
MDEHLAQLLANTQDKNEGPRKQAELDLLHAQTNPEFPLSLARIGVHTGAPLEIRQAALTYLRKFIEENWAPDEEGGASQIPIPDATRDHLRNVILELALSPEDERKVKVAASYAVSKIANADFPDRWPALLPSVLGVMPAGTDAQLHGALRILQDLVEESLSDEQFFSAARDIIKACYDVALNEGRKQTHRSMAVLVFRSCFDLLDIVKDDRRKEVKTFAEEVLSGWLPFLEQVIKAPLPPLDQSGSQPESWNGPVALKDQAVETLIKIRAVFPSLLVGQSPALFTATWEELSRLAPSFQALFIDSDAQSRLEDIDGLPYTLDFLVVDELDFLNQCMRAPPVQKQLDAEIKARGAVHDTPWALDLMALLVSFSQITQEEEGLWDIDVCLYLAEETSVSANYTPRTACGDLVIKLAEWLGDPALEALYAYTKTLFTGEGARWQKQEAALFLFTAILNDFQDMQKSVPAGIANAFLELVNYAVSRQDEPMLRARGFLAAGALAQSYQPAVGLLDRVTDAITRDESELVQVAAIKAVESFIRGGVPADRQVPIVLAIQHFLESKDLSELEGADDLLVTLLETLRSAISMDTRIAIQPDSKAVDLLFLIAKHGAASFHANMVVCETFEDIARTFKDNQGPLKDMEHPRLYAALCAKVLPSITGTFDVANLTQDDPLVTLAADLLALLVQYGSEPLPDGFVAATLPKLHNVLMTSTEGDILRPGSVAVKYILMHDHKQVFSWHDNNGRSGLEVCLRIIDRLLGPNIEDNAASEVGGLAAELVEKAGHERLGPFLPQLLQAVATRLDSAQAAPFIQSLILVFARLSLVGAQDVVNFLSDIQINGQVGLQVVLGKWLENSINFAGYDEIRQNVIALSKLYSLNDPRVAQTMVKGDLIITNTDRIMTRSRAKLNPDQYTIIPAPLKILKVLIEDLVSASGMHAAANVAAAAVTELANEDEDEDNDGWEDVPDDTLDLALGSTKADLMSWGEGGSSRQRDDETQAYLVDFFIRADAENIAEFHNWSNMLTDDEKRKVKQAVAQ